MYYYIYKEKKSKQMLYYYHYHLVLLRIIPARLASFRVTMTMLRLSLGRLTIFVSNGSRAKWCHASLAKMSFSHLTAKRRAQWIPRSQISFAELDPYKDKRSSCFERRKQKRVVTKRSRSGCAYLKRSFGGLRHIDRKKNSTILNPLN